MSQQPVGFLRDRRTLALVVNRFACMLEQRLHGECMKDDQDYFRLPDGTHFDRLVAMLAEIGDKDSDAHPIPQASLLDDSDEDLLEEALDALQRIYDAAPPG